MEYIFEDVNEALPVLWDRMLSNDGIHVDESRNGPVRVSDFPATIIYKNPRRHILFCPVRDANPFFHLFETIWMLAGRNDVMWLARFNKKMLDFSDDGSTLISAYGRLWDETLPQAIEKIRKDRHTRRAYCPIFIPEHADLNGKDIPCNLGFTLHPHHGELNISVFNRSNDMIWGALGANYTTFSFLLEYIAALVDMEVGYYAQISTNFHMYSDFDITKKMKERGGPTRINAYESDELVSVGTRILNARTPEGWQEDAKWFIDNYTFSNTVFFKDQRWWKDVWFRDVAAPMYRAWHLYRYAPSNVHPSTYSKSIHDELEKITSSDWCIACRQWLNRRLKERRAKWELSGPKETVAVAVSQKPK
jgi:hypothetical protein